MSETQIPYFPPRAGRVHEACGAGALAFAAMLGARLAGDVIWCVEGWRKDILNPQGLAAFADPSRVLLVKTSSQNELLAVAEEALRDGAVPLVVLELTAPLGLTPGRRLQLAAAAGKTTGLCLIPEGMGSNAAESRWHCTPIFDQTDSTLQNWEIIKNKSGTLGAWNVRWDAASRRLHVVSPVGERPGSSRASD